MNNAVDAAFRKVDEAFKAVDHAFETVGRNMRESKSAPAEKTVTINISSFPQRLKAAWKILWYGRVYLRRTK